MDSELTRKFQDIFQKCQAWVDYERYVPRKFRVRSWSEEFAEEVMRALENEMIKQKLSFTHDKIYLPSKYFVQISQADSCEFSGIKRELLIQELNKFVERCFHTLSVEYLDSNFVQICTSPELQKGEIKIVHQWEESYTPKIWFNQPVTKVKSDEFCEFSENTISDPVFWKSDADIAENDCETVIRKKLSKFYSLDIWRSGVRQNNLPVFQLEITLGRGSQAICVDVLLEGDREISRYHATLKYQAADEGFNLSVSGQNPVIVAGKAIFAGQSTVLNWEQVFQIGSYVLKIQR